MSFYFLEATAFAKLFVREAGTDALIKLMETAEDNRKLISAATPLEDLCGHPAARTLRTNWLR